MPNSPLGDEGEDRARLVERVGQLRHLIETVDLLYDAFLAQRLGAGWPKELERDSVGCIVKSEAALLKWLDAGSAFQPFDGRHGPSIR